MMLQSNKKYVILAYLLVKVYLCSHNPLPFLNEAALRALAVAVCAGFLVAAQAGDEAVVPAPSALWHPRSTAVHHPLSYLYRYN